MIISIKCVTIEGSLNVVEDVEMKEELEKDLTTQHNGHVFNIDLESLGKYDRNQVTILVKRGVEKKDRGNDMEVSKGEEESIETTFHYWNQKEVKFFYQEIWKKEDQEYEAQDVG